MKKKLFLIIFTLVILLGSLGILNSYRYIESENQDFLADGEAEDLSTMIIRKIDELSDEYNLYSIKEFVYDDNLSVDENNQRYEKYKTLNDQMKEYLSNSNFYYQSLINSAKGLGLSIYKDNQLFFQTNDFKQLNQDLVIYLEFKENKVIINQKEYSFEMFNDIKLSNFDPDYQVDEIINVNFPEGYHATVCYDYKTLFENGYLYIIPTNNIEPNVFIFVGTISIIIFIIGLLIPVKQYQKLGLFNGLSKMKCIFVLILLGLCVLSSVSIASIVIFNTVAYDLFNLNYEFVKNIALLINYLGWILYIIIFLLVAYYIKYMFSKPFKTFIKEDTLIYVIYSGFKKIIDHLLMIDFTNKSIIRLIIIIIINSLLVCLIGKVISRDGFIGLILLSVYSILIFILAYRTIKQFNNDYNKFFIQTKKVASGNFESDNDLNTETFKNLEVELNNIKYGFEKAVKEETKSQLMKTELISNVSHDLKTPLTGIKNYIELLKDSNISDDQRNEYLNTLDKYSNRLKSLIDDLFEVSKATSGDIKLNLTDIDIVTLIEQTLDENYELLEEAHLKPVINKNIDKLIIKLDSDKTYRIFSNLVINASKYSVPNTRLYIDIENNDHKVDISFKNVSLQEMNFDNNEIIERFARGDKSRSDGGSGLGLAICKSFTEALGGSFEIKTDGDLFKAIVSFKY